MTSFIPHKPYGRCTATAITIMVFGCLYALSQTLLHDVYMFEWMVRNLYYFIWIPALICAVFNKIALSHAITFGNLVGVIAGQLLGDFIVSYNIICITPDITVHHGTFIWMIIVLVFVVAGILLQIVSSSYKQST